MTLKFEFPEMTTGRCTATNVHSVLHGDQKREYGEFNIEVDLLDQRDLDRIAPGLRATIFCSVAGEAGQTDLPGTSPIWPDLNFPDMKGPLGFDRTLQGYRFECDYGLGPEAGSNIILPTCKIKSIKVIRWHKGGSATVGFQGQSYLDDLTMDEKGKLVTMNCRPTLKFSLRAPEAEVEDVEVKETKQTPAQALQASLGMDSAAAVH